MRLSVLCIFCCVLQPVVHAQPVAAGDIALLGFNADNNDQFSIILTNYIEDGSIIYFTDAGWSGTGFYPSEGHIQWTVPSGGLPTGTIVTFTGGGSGGFTVFGTGALEAGANASLGTIAATASSSSMAFSTSGDQIIAYIGTMASPVFIACVNFNGAWSYGSSTQTQIPSGLTVGTDCVLLANHDNGIIDCSLLPDPATVADYNNASNWVYNDATRYTLPPAAVACDLLLPVIISDFKGINAGEEIILNWTTASEINSDQFAIEKSIDGTEFILMGIVDAAGYSEQKINYEFKDDHPFTGKNYYRLKMVDLNGKFEYSPVLAVINDTQSMYVISPNPANSTFIISPQQNITGPLQVKLFTSTGICMADKNLICDAPDSAFEFDCSELPGGIYLIMISNERSVFSERIVINH